MYIYIKYVLNFINLGKLNTMLQCFGIAICLITDTIYLEPNIYQVQQLYTLQSYGGLGKFNPILY